MVSGVGHSPRQAAHVVLDNLSAHMGPEVTKWLDHPQAQTLAPALHSHLFFVVEPRRTVVQGIDRPVGCDEEPSPASLT